MRQQLEVKEFGDWLWVPIPKEIAEKYRLREGSVLDLLADHHGFAIRHYVGRRHRDHPISIAERAAESQVLVKAEPEHVPEPSEFGLVSKSDPTASVEVPPGARFFSMDDDAPPAIISSPESSSLRCAQLQPRVAPLEKRVGVPDAVYEEGLLEHPAIPGLMLTKDERLYGALLEMIDSDGALRIETFEEKRFRIKWKQPIPVANTESLKSFVKMHHESFGPPKNR
jgi:hypothetical protein